jgi:hypothetical protein
MAITVDSAVISPALKVRIATHRLEKSSFFRQQVIPCRVIQHGKL